MTDERFSGLEQREGYRAADWAGDGAQRWASVAVHLEAQLEPVADLLHQAAGLQPGEVVLDVGCGRGVTTRAAAAQVAPTGAVTGVDIATNLVDEARELTPSDLAIDWVVADAQHHDFADDHYDAVVSRFGVMFFDDAVQALVNLRRATRSNGRLCVVVWQRRERSEVMQLPLDIAARAASEHGALLDVGPADGGGFAWADGALVTAALESAGWRNVSIDPHVLDMYVCGPGPVDRIVDTSVAVGGLRATLADQPAELVDAVRSALLAEYADRHDGTGVKLEGAVAVVTARA